MNKLQFECRVWLTAVFGFLRLFYLVRCWLVIGDANGKRVRLKAAVRSHVKSGHHFEEVRIW